MGFWKALGEVFSGQPKQSVEPPTPSEAKAKTPKELFRESFVAVLEQHPRVGRYAPNPNDEFSLLVWPPDATESTNPGTIFLNNIFHETREMDPEQRSQEIHRFLRVLEQSSEDQSWDEAADSLVPVLRAASFAAFSEVELLSREFVPFLRIYVGVDRDSSTSFVSTKVLAEWQQEASLLHELAVANFARHVADSDVEPYDAESGSVILHVTANDSYEPSRLALPGFLAGFASRVPGAPVAIVPDRSRLLICGSGDPEAVARLAKIAETEFEAASRSLSPALYSVDGEGQVVPMTLPADHPQHFLVARGHRLLAADAYATQKKRLEKQFQADEIDIFVATCGLLRKKDGQTQTWASFAEGVDALLPEVDLLCLSGGEGEDEWYAHVEWSGFFEIAGGCLERDDDYEPARFRTVGWLDAAQREQLGDLVKLREK